MARAACLELATRASMLGVGGPAPGLGLVHRHHAEELAARAAERHEERIVRLPGVGIVGGLDRRGCRCGPGTWSQSKLPRGHEVAPRRSKRGASSGIQVSRSEVWPSSICDRLVGAHGGRGEHVVERGPVDVHDHGAVAERLADRARHLPEHVLEVLVRAHRGRALEHRAEAADHREGSGVHHGRAPMRKRRNGERDVPVTGLVIGGRPGSL